MDWKKASQVAQVVGAISIAVAALWYVYDSVAKVDALERGLCIAEARANLHVIRLSAANSYTRYVNAKVNQAKSHSSDRSIGHEFGAPNLDIEEAKKRAEILFVEGQRKLDEADALAERISKANRIEKNCREIVEGITITLKGN